jgi:hypothetical protein
MMPTEARIRSERIVQLICNQLEEFHDGMEQMTEVMEVVSNTTPTFVLGEMFVHSEPVEGADGPGINVEALSNGMPCLEPEEAIFVDRMNRFARNTSMMYLGAGWFRLGYTPVLRYGLENPRATRELRELAETTFYYWRRAIQHPAGGYFQCLTASETERLLLQLQFNSLIGDPI